MALGKNIEMDQLIPEVKKEAKKNTKTKEKKASIAKGGEEPKKESYHVIITPSRRKKIRKVKVGLEGELTIINAAKIKEEVMPVFDDFDYVDFALNNVVNIDCSCIQLLLALKTYYNEKDKEVTIKMDVPKELKDILSNSGFGSLTAN